ncbi:P-loop containing nucleoside triphosphate hydrolase protein [Mycena rosella]|uniref:P-loop containing nucleoside triphosphate hydrolase protein n=1 Tax=Mycena rosella TaxID=1033263 RepID=A0AAD7CYF4_MYCRO|nr:P-loop containing nucleoside triphosphate hydrolase protein [Mycena rosella]
MGAIVEKREKLVSETLKDPTVGDNADAYTSLDLGVWKVLLARENVARGFGVSMDRWNTVTAAYPLLLRFLKEVYALDPQMVILFILLKLWGSVESVLLLYVSSRLLQVIEVGLAEGRPDVHAITQAIVARLILTLTATTNWMRDFTCPVLESRVSRYFEDYLLRANLRLDLPTSTDSSSKSQARPGDAWRSFDGLCEVAQRVFALVSQLAFISQQASGGLAFTLVAVVRPVWTLTMHRTLWLKPHVVYSENTAYLRAQSLQSMSASRYRADVIAGNIAGWITSEYRRARDALGTVSEEDAWSQYGMERTPVSKIASEWTGELPTLYWALNAMLRPAKFSMSSIAILQQYSASLNYSLQMLFWDVSEVGKCVTDIKILYETANIKNQIADGDAVYPRASADVSESQGMDIELQNVSFAYPGEKSKESALRDVSFYIPAGALAVIVGANGSGKSTIIKLLRRMYDADSGVVHVDGLPIADYRLADLRQAQATLTQDHELYPLTLGENIGLGYAEHVDDEEMVMQAARDGGAAALLDKFTDGMKTNLKPVMTAYGYQLDDEKHKSLKTVLGKLEKTAEVSGGEKQRLVASRTFMRFRTGKIKLLSVDEPSSALDPTGEFELFERLRETGEGKTMIFVTHRFGHLTKHADIIICMKEGKVAESGTHKELIALGGEYASLYNVQAQAFTESEVISESNSEDSEEY